MHCKSQRCCNEGATCCFLSTVPEFTSKFDLAVPMPGSIKQTDDFHPFDRMLVYPWILPLAMLSTHPLLDGEGSKMLLSRFKPTPDTEAESLFTEPHVDPNCCETTNK